MPVEIPAARVRLIERIIVAARALTRKASNADYAAFLKRYFQGVAQEDLLARAAGLPGQGRPGASTRRRAARTGSRRWCPSWMAVERRRRAGPHTLVAVVTDDMPFLVDSLLLAFSSLGIGVHLIIHPLFDVTRDRAGRLVATADAAAARRESWQLFEVDRQIDPQRLRADQDHPDARRWPTCGRRWPTGSPCCSRRAPPSAICRPQACRSEADAAEAQSLIEWMAAGSFHLPRLSSLSPAARRPAGSARAAGADRAWAFCAPPRAGVAPPAPTALTGALRREARAPRAVLVTKANSRATVHRGSYLDYVGVRTFDARGRVTGEHRFLGLWTSSAYESSPRTIPLLKHKINAVIGAFDAAPGSHDAKAAGACAGNLSAR